MADKILVTRSSMPDFDQYVNTIRPLWDSCWLTNSGKYHQEFEARLKSLCQVDNLCLTVNGHLALELVIEAMDFPKGSEVITTPFTFTSTTNAIVRNGLEPVFCDIKESDFTIDESKIEELITDKTVAILPVHVYGNPCNVETIEAIAVKHGLAVIYDAAHAFGEVYKGRGIAAYGDASIFSFHATKVFNSIEGGAVCADDPAICDKINVLKNFGLEGEDVIGECGTNGKMNEFCAAFGLCNLGELEANIARRKTVVELYHTLLRDVKEIRLNTYCKDLVPNYAYLPAILDSGKDRDDLYRFLKDNDIYARKYFYPLTCDALYLKEVKAYDVDVARDISDRVLTLPLYADMTQDQVKRVCECILKYFN